MGKSLGDSVGEQTDTMGFSDADETTAAGDAVALASGDAEPADGDAGHAFLGVRSSNRQLGDKAPIHVRGVVIASVASGITAGADLDIGTATNSTVGALAASSGGPVHALSDEGGSYDGASLDAGEAAVLVR